MKSNLYRRSDTVRNGINLRHTDTQLNIRKYHKSSHIIQISQLSLTNPRDALHYDKRQNFKTVTPLLWVIFHPVARINIAYLCTKFDEFKFSLSSHMIGAPYFNGSHDMTTPLSRTVCRP